MQNLFYVSYINASASAITADELVRFSRLEQLFKSVIITKKLWNRHKVWQASFFQNNGSFPITEGCYILKYGFIRIY